jgi:hypothetical protein
MKRLLYHCHRLFYTQLSSWTAYGILNDPYQEFFIQQLHHSANAPSSSTSLPSTITELLAVHDNKESKGLSLETPLAVTVANVDDSTWNREYSLCQHMLPLSYLPLSVANKVPSLITIILNLHDAQ